MSVQSVHPTSTKLRVFAALIRILFAGSLILLFSPVSPARADTPVCGPITVDTTWTLAGNDYIVTCDVTVSVGITLTIESDVVVKFEPGTSLIVAGELLAQAATFTSNNPTPAIGDWGQIFFTATSEDAVFDDDGNYVSGSIVQANQIEWGGGGEGVNGEVEIAGASPFIDNNTIRYSGSRGVYAFGRSSEQKIRISHNTVSNNNGGGVYISTAVLANNTVASNHTDVGPGGVYAVNSILESNDVSQNDTDNDNGGGIYAAGCTLNDNTVSGNWNEAAGGGIYADGSTLTNNTISGNRTDAQHAYGGGVYATGSSLTNNIVEGNTANHDYPYQYGGSARGGGIYAALSTLTGNTIRNNTASAAAQNIHSYGGGVYSSGGSASSNTVEGNTATAQGTSAIGRGGGFYADGGVLSNNTVDNNTASGNADSMGGGVYGSLNAISNNTLSGNGARRGGAIYSNMGTVTNNTITNNTTSWTGSIYMYEGTALGNTLEGNSAVNGGGLYGYNAVLSGNTVQGNTANVGGGIASSEGTVRGNTVTGNAAQSDGGGIYAEGGTVTENTITGNTVPSFGHGSGAYLLGAVEFTYNSVLTNTAPGGTAGGISIFGQPLVQFNNLYGNQPYDAEVLSGDPVTGTLNYWGESLCTEIPWQIYDGNDLPGRGILSYAPSLYSPVPLAQLDAPTGLEIDIGEDGAALSWTPIAPIPDVGCRPPGSTEPDLVYHIWYSISDPCGPYDGTGLPAGDSPIDAGEATSYLLNGLGPGAYYFVVAAHDYLDRESAFTNVVVKPPEGYWVFLPLVVRGW
jgi:putative cofactor-binding repeat protein